MYQSTGCLSAILRQSKDSDTFSKRKSVKTLSQKMFFL